jgi:hypothetical protein
MNGRKWGVTMLFLTVMLAGSGCGKQQTAVEAKQGTLAKGAAIVSDIAEQQEASLSPHTGTTQQTPQAAPNKPYRSAAYPGYQGDAFATDSEMKALLRQAESYFNAKPFDVILEKGGNGAPGEMVAAFADTSITSVYRSLKSNAPGEVPILGLSIGQGVNVLNDHGLLWYENGQWRAQPYPQVPNNRKQKRAEVFKKANIGYGSFEELHQAGNRLAVVYSYSGTRMAQEVQLLQRDNGVWRILWLPTYDNWLQLLNTRIEFHDGINSFTEYHQEEQNKVVQWQEEWKLQGDQYVKVSSTKQ